MGKIQNRSIYMHISLLNAEVYLVPQNTRRSYGNEIIKSVTRYSFYRISPLSLEHQGWNNSLKIFIGEAERDTPARPHSSLIRASCESQAGNYAPC